MKNKIFISIIVTILFYVSCSDPDAFLNERPSDAILTEDAIRNEVDLSIAVNGLYNLMQDTDCFGSKHFTYQELTADRAFVGILNSNRFVKTNDWTYQADTNGEILAMWNHLYKIIANTNLILKLEGLIDDDVETADKPNDLFAQAKAIRALSYYTLLLYFSPNFGSTNDALGVPMPLVYDAYVHLDRSSITDVTNQIIMDLNSAISLFSANYEPSNKRTIGITATNQIFARVSLFKKDYPNAILYADKIISSTNSTFLPSAEVASYFAISGETNAETIFQLDFNSTDLPGANDSFLATWSSDGRYKQNFMTRDFFNTIPATDVRKGEWYVDNAYVNGLADSPKPIDVRKYLSVDRDIVLMRKSEAIFIKAEAEYQTNPETALNTVKTWVIANRDPSYAPTATGSAILTEILNQKNIELFAEGFRFSDLKRNNLPIVKTQTGLNITASDYRFTWPIPRDEFDGNPNISTQNPGY